MITRKKWKNGKIENLKNEKVTLTPKLNLNSSKKNSSKKRTATNCSFFIIKNFKNVFLY